MKEFPQKIIPDKDEEIKMVLRLISVSKSLKFLSWIALGLWIMWFIVLIADVVASLSLFGVVEVAFGSLAFMLVFAVLYGLSSLTEFVGRALWPRIGALGVMIEQLTDTMSQKTTSGNA